MRQLSILFVFVFCCSSLCVAQSLLRAQTYAQYDAPGVFHRTDSTWYYYSGSRGSSVAPHMTGGWIDFQNLEEHIEFDSSFSQSTMTGMPDTRIIHTYNAGNGVLTELTCSLVPIAATYRYENMMLLAHTCNVAGDRIYTSVKNWDAPAAGWWESSRAYYTVNALHGIDTVLNDMNDFTTAGAWVHAKRLISGYDAAGNRTSVLIQNPDPSGWIDLGLNTMTYDASGNLLSRFVQLYMPDSLGVYSWVNLEKWDNTFNAANRAVSSAFIWYGGAATGVLTRLDSCVYDAHSNLITATRQSLDATATLTNSRCHHYTYNTYDQLTTVYTNTWDAATNTWGLSADVADPDFIRRYYYSDTPNAPFDPIPHHTTQVVAVCGKSGCELNLFPLPAGSTLNINITWHTAQPFMIAVCDVQGRVWAEWTGAPCTHYTDVLPVAHMPSGNYILKVTGTNGTEVRQFVVEH